MPLYYCPECELEFEPARLHDLETCPACGGELEERRRADLCAHSFAAVGTDEDGWVQRRCVKCGEWE